MSLPLSPARLRAVYAALQSFPPFCNWDLPAPQWVEFKVSKARSEFGHYNRYVGTDKHWISISSAKVGYLNTLTSVMAHEMIHLYQGISKTETPGAEHNAEFRRIARQVCARFGWDIKEFC